MESEISVCEAAESNAFELLVDVGDTRMKGRNLLCSWIKFFNDNVNFYVTGPVDLLLCNFCLQ